MAKILIVDDAAFMRKVIRDTLTKNGFTDLHEAVDGKDAVEKYFELQPDLVLMDITMPNMDGLEALKAIRAKDNKANVVMCSAMGQEAMVVEAVQAGIKDFIVKPFKEDRLMKTVNSILGIPDGSGPMPEVLWTICAILGVLVLAYLFTRYVAGRGQGGGPSRLGKRMLTILDQVAVGKDQRLLLVRAGETYYFLG